MSRIPIPAGVGSLGVGCAIVLKADAQRDPWELALGATFLFIGTIAVIELFRRVRKAKKSS
jgi:hypothetical protein